MTLQGVDAPSQPAQNKRIAQQSEALRRYRDRAGERERICTDLKTKTPFEVDTRHRAAARRRLIDPRDGLAYERILGRSDLFPISYLQAGLDAARPICRIEVRDPVGRVQGYGTGFLVSPALLMTNNHVLGTADSARFSLAQLNHETDLQLMPRPIQSFRLDPERFFLSDERLDFTLVAVEPASADGTRLTDFGFLKLLADSGKALLGEYVSIIQHPSGGPKAVAVRENEVVDVFDDFVHYKTDTEPGSSGSPVFNDTWSVVALHHAGVPDPAGGANFVANEGTRISSIVEFLSKQRASLSAGEKSLLDVLVAGGGAPAGGTVPQPLVVEELAAEWYEGAAGYDEAFLGEGYRVPPPVLAADLAADVAPLRDGGKLLRYTHFSVVMSKSRRLAFYTAVNVDGAQLEKVRRSGDKWYFDPRMDRKYQSGPELYESNDLDRGHLVRRLDPVWGERAREANEDTFHFTNCSPQHRQLNQKTWQNLEDYILRNAGRHTLKVSVFTGPVFRTDDLVYRGEFRIPAEFWKVVAMVRDDNELSVTAYLQTQKNLIDDLEFAYGQYRTYQVPLTRIEDLTGLHFGELWKHDPIGRLEATAGRAIERAEDIRL
jgi:endonuclease G